MNAADAIRNSLDVGHMVTQAYLSDMTDESALSNTKAGLNRSLEKGVRYRKCKAPFGPFRFSVPDPVFPANPES
jgi:hypothetical protein